MPAELQAVIEHCLRKEPGQRYRRASEVHAALEAVQSGTALPRPHAVRRRGAAAQDSRSFYEGYANDTLWPLLHGFVTRAVFSPESWHAYRDANERFADAAVSRSRRGDLVWAHDYQLMLVPRLVRERRADARIGFFLHIPFPSSDVFRILPEREEILLGLLGADSIAFQTHGDLHDFRRSLLQVLGLESQMDRVLFGDRTVQLAALPIGIQSDEWRHLTRGDPRWTARRITELKERHRGRKLILSVDRLDYTKGIPERLRTFGRLLEVSAVSRQVVLMQVRRPTRESVPAMGAAP